MTPAFDPLALLETLRAHGVRFVVIGGFAGNVLGSPTITNDLDICHDRSSRESRHALAEALKNISAQPREWPDDVPFLLDEKAFELGDTFTFTTSLGNLDCLATPAGTTGYADISSHAIQIDLGEGLVVHFASIEDLIRMKRASGRPKDLIELEILAAVAEERAHIRDIEGE